MLHCLVHYFPSVHLTHIYAGFEALHRSGAVRLEYVMNTRRTLSSKKPVLFVKVNNNRTLVYDLLDGFNWIEEGEEANLEFFHQHFKGVQHYFKRSYHQRLLTHVPEDCSLHPLGLNYVVKEQFMTSKGLLRQVKDRLAGRFLPNAEYEALPLQGRNGKILFRTILWDPAEAKTAEKKADREHINNTRIEMIRLGRKEFGADFSGGLVPDAFSRKHAPDLVINDGKTDRESYLRAVKDHSICVSTTGLHGSIPWKVGEYVAASRAIVTEPFQYELPGGFSNGTHYLHYNSTTEFLNQIALLRSNKEALHNMMAANWRYYNTWLKPECLVLNSLLTAVEE